jgi:hypothetical protein
MAKKDLNITSRRQLFDHLEGQMDAAYRQLLKARRLEYESTFLKTFLLEFNWDLARESLGTESPLEILTTVFSIGERRSKAMETLVTETDDEGLYSIRWSSASGVYDLYVDMDQDPQARFWQAYTLSDSQEVETILERLEANRPALDRAWLWPDYLAQLRSMGEFRGASLNYDHRYFERAKGAEDPTEFLKAHIWGGPDSVRILEFLERDDYFASRAVLSKVRLKFWEESDDRDRFSLEDIKYNGKFTTRGSSFSSHQRLLNHCRETYAQAIRGIETDFVISYVADEQGQTLEGQPIHFTATAGGAWIDDVDVFCDVVFAGSKPFRLWGLVDELPGGGRYVKAVDLHSGSQVFFEVYPDLVAMYLHPPACGNSVARFFTNIQQTFSRAVEARGDDGRAVL